MLEHKYALVGLYLLGLVLFLAEVFIPSGGVLGVIATVCAGTSIFMLFYHGFSVFGSVLLVVTVAYLVIMVRWGLRRVTSTTDLAGAQSTGSDVLAAAQLVGCQGEAVTILRPAGVALINGQRFDVVTHGGFVEIGVRVQVAEADGNRIVVRAIQS